MRDNPVQEKSYRLSLEIVRLGIAGMCGKFWKIRDQVMASGTSVGAHVEEPLGGESRRDFIHKMRTAFKEARETRYWLRLISDSGLHPADQMTVAGGLAEECVRLLGCIVRTASQNAKRKPRPRRETG